MDNICYKAGFSTMHAETTALLRITLAVALLLATAAGGTG